MKKYRSVIEVSLSDIERIGKLGTYLEHGSASIVGWDFSAFDESMYIFICWFCPSKNFKGVVPTQTIAWTDPINQMSRVMPNPEYYNCCELTLQKREDQKDTNIDLIFQHVVDVIMTKVKGIKWLANPPNAHLNEQFEKIYNEKEFVFPRFLPKVPIMLMPFKFLYESDCLKNIQEINEAHLIYFENSKMSLNSAQELVHYEYTFDTSIQTYKYLKNKKGIASPKSAEPPTKRRRILRGKEGSVDDFKNKNENENENEEEEEEELIR